MRAVATATRVRSVNPATLDVVWEAPVASEDEIDEAVAAAGTAQKAWRHVPASERRRRFDALEETLLDRADEIARTIRPGSGKPLVEAYSSELFVAAESARWIGRNAGRVLGAERLRTPRLIAFKRGHVLNEPLGVVGVISPWNYPLAVPFTQIAAVVGTGNGAVLKPSELTPLTGELVGQLFRDAGFRRTSCASSRRRRDGTRSRGGRWRCEGHLHRLRRRGPGGGVHSRSAAPAGDTQLGGGPARRLRRLRLPPGACRRALGLVHELRSGLLWSRADLRRAAPLQPVHEELAAKAGRLRIGRGDDPDVDLGPLITESQLERTEDLVEDAVTNGATVVAGGERPETGLPGWFFEPTVLAGERIEGRAADEELFGPVVTVEPFDTEEQAVSLANGSPYALGASVWTTDAARARRVSMALDAGAVWTNDIAYSYFFAQAPWGGRKGSGYGRTHGFQGLRELVSPKYVDEDSGRVAVPWWYPYGADGIEGLRGGLELLYRKTPGARVRGAAAHRSGLARLTRQYLGRR